MLGCGNSKLSEDVGRGRFPDIRVLTYLRQICVLLEDVGGWIS